MINKIVLSGQIIKVYPERQTLSRLPVVSFLLEHKSRQIEASNPREVKCRVYCLMVDAKQLCDLDLNQKLVQVTGFLSQNIKLQLVLHINELEFLDKGILNGTSNC